MTKHRYHRDTCCCLICQLGPETCLICGGIDIELPTECPGVPMTKRQKDAVVFHGANFKGGVWTGLDYDIDNPDASFDV
jgi:hypothetical protein